MLTEKAYDATIRLGVATTTDDAEGEVLATAPTAGTRRRRRSAPRSPRSSATSSRCRRRSRRSRCDGKRAYQRVRDGRGGRARGPTGHRPRAAWSHEIGAAGDAPRRATSRVRCSSGTYIRAIARDLGAALGVGGHLTALRRTAVGPFGLDRGPHPRRSWPSSCALMPIAEAARASLPGRRPRPPTRPTTCAWAARWPWTSARRAGGALRPRRGVPRALRAARCRGRGRSPSSSG